MNAIYNTPLLSGCTYHIYNQGNNRENIFKQPTNNYYFLKRYQQYIAPLCDTYAYCLLPNHFHILVQFKSPKLLHQAFPKRFPKPTSDNREEIDAIISAKLSQQFGGFFSGYARAINNKYNRRGSLFLKHFKRVQIDTPGYFTHMIAYIHRNPIHHGFCTSYTEWPYSSYLLYLRQYKTWVATDFVYDWFGSHHSFVEYHQHAKEAYLDTNLYLE